ncbi:MAG: hypothetical protein JSV02_10670 [Dehalococcoidia bacterium]|nr:MAG: hypothetical protein JSV02_10670 [Dehalococcoidia bacterium]
MVTMEMNARPEIDPEAILREMKAKRQRKNRVARYQICREANALTILMFGIGFLIFVIGLCTGLLTVPHGFVGWIATWVVAFALRSYCGTVSYEDRVDYEPEY